MSKAKEETVVVTEAPVKPLGVWGSITLTFSSIAGVIVGTARVLLKTVEVVENEVDNIKAYQDIRLDEAKLERSKLPALPPVAGATD